MLRLERPRTSWFTLYFSVLAWWFGFFGWVLTVGVRAHFYLDVDQCPNAEDAPPDVSGTSMAWVWSPPGYACSAGLRTGTVIFSRPTWEAFSVAAVCGAPLLAAALWITLSAIRRATWGARLVQVAVAAALVPAVWAVPPITAGIAVFAYARFGPDTGL